MKGRPAHELSDVHAEQALLLEVIASVADGLGVYAADGEQQWVRVKWPVVADVRERELHSVMREFARSVTASLAGRDVDRVRSAHASGIARDISIVGDCYRLRAIGLTPGFFGAHASVLVIADRLREETPNRHRLSEQFGLTA